MNSWRNVFLFLLQCFLPNKSHHVALLKWALKVYIQTFFGWAGAFKRQKSSFTLRLGNGELHFSLYFFQEYNIISLNTGEEGNNTHN